MKILQKIAVIILVVFMGIVYCYPTTARAENMINLDKTSIDEDMADIDVLYYPKNPLGSPRVIMLQEYCYTVRKNLVEYYGLYVYVYNPTEKEITTDKENVVNMAVSYGTDGKPSSYENVKLIYLDKNESNRFYKFKIENPLRFLELEKSYMKKYDKRRYDIAGIQLYHTDNTSSEDNTVGKTYYFTGYGKGCGADYNAESTLECNEEVLETISLKVTLTQYRAGDSNGKDDYTRDSLHSVFFSVPNKNIEESGDLWGVKAQWLDAVLNPALVTGSKYAKAVSGYLGTYVENGYSIDGLKYAFASDFKEDTAGNISTSHATFSYNIGAGTVGSLFLSDYYVNCLYLLFDSGSDDDSADYYAVSSEQIIKEAKQSVDKYGGELVLDRYSKSIFESVADKKTVVELDNDDEINLESGTLTKNFWQKLFGGSTYVSDEEAFKHLKIVVPVTAKDLEGLTDKQVSDTFCVGLVDVSSLRTAVSNAEKNDETVHLFRYQVTDYMAREVNVYECKNTLLTGPYLSKDSTNAYFFQETVNLDFEVIDLKFKKEDVVTVIPVVMSPIDIFPSSDVPVNTNKDNNDLWKIIFGILGIILIFVILYPILPYIVQLVVWIITLPFKLIKKLINGGKKRR